MLFEVRRGRLDPGEVEPLVGVQVEHQPVGLFDILHPAAPAVELDRPHLDAGKHAIGIVDPQIGFGRSVLFANVDMMDMVAEAACVMLLEEALLGTSLRTTHQTDRAMGEPGEQDRRDRGIIVGELTLGDLRVGKDHAVTAADLHVALRRGWRRGGGFGHDLGGRLVVAQRDEAGVADDVFGGEFGKGDLRDQLGRDPVCAACRDLGHIGGRRLACDAREFVHQRGGIRCVESRTDLAGIAQRPALMHAEQQRTQPSPTGAAGQPAEDHEFLPPCAFDLEPAFRTLAAIGRIGTLRDDAFMALAAHRLEQFFARTKDVF